MDGGPPRVGSWSPWRDLGNVATTAVRAHRRAVSGGHPERCPEVRVSGPERIFGQRATPRDRAIGPWGWLISEPGGRPDRAGIRAPAGSDAHHGQEEVQAAWLTG